MNENNNSHRQHSSQDGVNHIVCDVANCVYNTEERQCTAKEVKVGPQFASSSADTICVTFKP